MRHWTLPVRVVLGCWLMLAGPASTTTLTLSQAQLLALDDVTAFFGGNGEILASSAAGDGVLFEIESGTIDFGKVAGRLLIGGADLSPYDAFGLHFEIVSASEPVELNPFVQTGGLGGNFFEDVPGAKVEGEAFDALVSLVGIAEPDWGYALGFQYFTAGGLETPASQTVLIAVTPLAGAEVLVPEPSTLMLWMVGLAFASAHRRSRLRRSDRAPVQSTGI